MRAAIPSRSLGLLMAIGFADLVMTAWFHARGMIVELNPLMRAFIERSEWLFVLVKGTTLLVAWVAMARYARTNLDFVRKACVVASVAYLVVWTTWFAATC